MVVSSAALLPRCQESGADLLFDAIRRLAERYYPSQCVLGIGLEMDNGDMIHLPAPTPDEPDSLDMSWEQWR